MTEELRMIMQVLILITSFIEKCLFC